MSSSQNLTDLAIFLPSARAGGAVRAMIDLAGGLSRRGLNVALILGCAEGPFLESIDPSVQVLDLRINRMRFAVPCLTRQLRSPSSDVVHHSHESR